MDLLRKRKVRGNVIALADQPGPMPVSEMPQTVKSAGCGGHFYILLQGECLLFIRFELDVLRRRRA